jgi:hypothetical protein
VVAAYVGQLILGQPGVADIPGYATTYFPGTSNPPELRLVEAPASQDAESVNFALSRTATAAVSGVARTSTGEPITGGLVLASSRRSGPVATALVGARIHPDGTFEFPNVPPGQYVIQAYRGRSKPWLEGEFAAVSVTVNGADVRGIEVQTSPGSTISGRVTFDGWGLKRVLINGVDVTDATLPFGSKNQSLADVEVMLTDAVTEIRGTASDDRGRAVADAQVVVFAGDRDLWYERSRFVKMATSGADGAFLVRDLPPGNYFVAAVDRRRASEDNGEWLNPELLDALAPGAASITLAEGQRLSVSPRLAAR